MNWGLTRAGHQNAGRVIAWVGMSMFAALAFGAPAGTATLRDRAEVHGSRGRDDLGPLVTILLVLAAVFRAGRARHPRLGS